MKTNYNYLQESHPALTYDDVLLKPRYSEVLPHEVTTKTQLSRNVSLNIPVLSAAMDTVTETEMAKAMAYYGGIGVLHKNQTPAQQAEMVQFIKNSSVDHHNINSKEEKLEEDDFANPCVDSEGRFRVAAAVGVGPKEVSRAKELIKAGCDVLFIDTAHGHSKAVIEMVKQIRELGSSFDIVAGNVATAAGCEALIEAGVDGIKVGVGPGSICITRVVAGVGVPQLQAVMEASQVCIERGVPFIADGGIKHSGDAVKALAAGASTVMIGSLLAGCDESPGERFISGGVAYKMYRGMGARSAMTLGSKDRYGQASVTTTKKLVSEGVEGLVPATGPVSEHLFQIVGGIRSGMGYLGAGELSALPGRAEFLRISHATLKESHPHDLADVRPESNYRP